MKEPMTPEQEIALEHAALLTSFANGKKIESRDRISSVWIASSNPKWNFARYEYRLAPEPRTVWISEYGDEAMALHRKPPKFPDDFGPYFVHELQLPPKP